MKLEGHKVVKPLQKPLFAGGQLHKYISMFLLCKLFAVLAS